METVERSAALLCDDGPKGDLNEGNKEREERGTRVRMVYE